MTSNVFCLLNCFNNYEICASKLIEFYITNAVNALNNGKPVTIKTYFDSTPYQLYAIYNSGGTSPDVQRSKQMTEFVTILGLAAVTLARVWNADSTIFAAQGVVTSPGFATIFTAANMLNKKAVYWTDDLRNIWGTTDDPLFIGMAPLPYKYLWTAAPNPKQPADMDVQPKGLNGSDCFPNLAGDKDLCPVVSLPQFEQNWNSFIDLLNRASSTAAQTTSGTPSSRIKNLIDLGNAIISYVETTKDPKYGRGWVPGADTRYFNATLYFDLEYVIGNHLNLLFIEEREFFTFNSTTPVTEVSMTSDANHRGQSSKTNVYNNTKYVPSVLGQLSKSHVGRTMSRDIGRAFNSLIR